MKITSYIFISFLFVFFLFSITTFISFQLSKAVNENVEYISRSTEITKNSGKFQRNMLNMVSGLRGYLLTGQNYFVESYDTAVSENATILALLSATITDTFQRKQLEEIKRLNDHWVAEYTDPLRQAKEMAHVNDSNLLAYNKLYKEKLTTGNEKQLQLTIQARFKDFANYEYDQRDARSEKLAGIVQKSRNITLLLTILSLISGFIVVTFLIQQISKRIAKMVGLADEIASGNYNVNMHDDGKDELSALVKSLNHMANELAKNITILETKNKELNQFAHIVSHDLKGPLRGIDNVIKWIEEDHHHEISAKVREYLETIQGRVVRAENLIQGILSYARIDTEVMEKEPINLNALVQEVLDNLPLSPNIHIEVAQLPRIYTEKLPLFQIFSNLIDNAIKYNDKRSIEIKVYCQEHPEYYEFFVADNGPGIAENYHERIFIIFQTLKERDSFESTGVGLAIVKKILDARKENIKVISEPGHGSIFSFTWTKGITHETN